jgi:hypothetical protein
MDLGFPSGATLRQEIVRKLSNPDYALELLNFRITKSQINKLLRALKFGCFETIDELLSANQELALLGKVIIADIISLLEDEEKLVKSLQEDFWARDLVRYFAPNSDESYLGDLNLNFINLNYDRSFDTIIRNCLPERNKVHGKKYLNPNILNLHGSLGNLNDIPYGEFKDPMKGLSYNPSSFALSHSISVLHENERVSSAYDKATQILAEADLVYFIGFGYHREVLDRLKISWSEESKDKYYGLRFGIEDSQLPKDLPINFYPKEWKCKEFVQMLDGRIEEIFSLRHQVSNSTVGLVGNVTATSWMSN